MRALAGLLVLVALLSACGAPFGDGAPPPTPLSVAGVASAVNPNATATRSAASATRAMVSATRSTSTVVSTRPLPRRSSPRGGPQPLYRCCRRVHPCQYAPAHRRHRAPVPRPARRALQHPVSQPPVSAAHPVRPAPRHRAAMRPLVRPRVPQPLAPPVSPVLRSLRHPVPPARPVPRSRFSRRIAPMVWCPACA